MSKSMSKAHKKKFCMPKRIISLENSDKGFMEDWSPSRDMLNFPHSFRLLCLGPPNVGKSTVVKNVIVRADPPFKQIFLIHCDIDGTTEYEDCDVISLHKMPNPYDEQFDREVKSLLIMDDMEFQYMSKEDKRKLDRLFGYTSTHRGLSICVCAQDMFNMIPAIRRMSNIVVLWKVLDLDLMNTIGRRVGMKKNEFGDLCKKHWKDIHDSVWVDLTKGTPYPLRINGYNCVDLNSCSNTNNNNDISKDNAVGVYEG